MDLILDSETTGLDGEDQVIELAIIDADTADILFNQRIRPTVPISDGAHKAHRIKAADLAGCEQWPAYHDEVSALLTRADRVLIYNADYDERMLGQTAYAFGLKMPDYKAVDLMAPYANIARIDYSPYHGNWQWQTLDAAIRQQQIDNSGVNWHSALGDCIATQRLWMHMEKAFERYFQFTNGTNPKYPLICIDGGYRVGHTFFLEKWLANQIEFDANCWELCVDLDGETLIVSSVYGENTPSVKRKLKITDGEYDRIREAFSDVEEAIYLQWNLWDMQS